MAEQHDHENPTAPVEIPVPPSPAALPDEPDEPGKPAHAVAMHAAFVSLCKAMRDILEDKHDHAAVLHAGEIMVWYMDGGAQIPRAWREAVILLEKTVGVRMRR